MFAQPCLDAPFCGALQSPFYTYFQGLDMLTQSMGPFVGPAKAAARCQLEAMSYMSRRTRAYMELPARLARCRTPQDLFAEQMSFWQTAYAQYSESSRRMMEAWQGQAVMQGAGRRGTRGQERDYITFPTVRDANGQAGSVTVREARRRVA